MQNTSFKILVCFLGNLNLGIHRQTTNIAEMSESDHTGLELVAARLRLYIFTDASLLAENYVYKGRLRSYYIKGKI